MAQTSDVPPEVELRPGVGRGTAGYFRLGQTVSGAWWLLDSDGQPFFLRAVNEVQGADGLPHDPAARLRTWGCNALGVGSDAALREDGLPWVGTVAFCTAGAQIHLAGARLPDVFDPEWPMAAANRAGEVCLPWCERRDLIGWITDNRPGWAQPGPAGRPALLQICLSLEPSFTAYHAAWEFVLALHGGRLEALARAWGHPAIRNKENVRELTRAEQGIVTRGYARDDARWSQEFARRYFALTAAAIRAHDPHHLIFGCRFGMRMSAAVLTQCVSPAVDVPWIDLDDLAQLPDGPVVAGDFTWVDPRFFGAPGARRARGLTTVERMLRRGRTVLERAARHPAVVGYAWSRWRDDAGEQPPFAGGLVHVNDIEAREHTELLTDLNARLRVLRGFSS
ncbi:MAG: hypothetical protein ABI222_11750 [Opitutaceae bacterium]